MKGFLFGSITSLVDQLFGTGEPHTASALSFSLTYFRRIPSPNLFSAGLSTDLKANRARLIRKVHVKTADKTFNPACRSFFFFFFVAVIFLADYRYEIFDGLKSLQWSLFSCSVFLPFACIKMPRNAQKKNASLKMLRKTHRNVK